MLYLTQIAEAGDDNSSIPYDPWLELRALAAMDATFLSRLG